MAEDIYIEIPEGVITDDELSDFILESPELFHEALHLNTKRHDERAFITDISFHQVEVEKDFVTIYYSFSYEAHYG